MREKDLRKGPMSDCAYVDEAATWARDMERRETRGHGDRENAWRRLEARYGIPWRTFWALRYRKPASITIGLYVRLQAAYRAECERQMKRLEHELEITKAKAGAHHPAVVQAQAVVDAADDLDIPPFLRR